jgi:hypothetical protein
MFYLLSLRLHAFYLLSSVSISPCLPIFTFLVYLPSLCFPHFRQVVASEGGDDNILSHLVKLTVHGPVREGGGGLKQMPKCLVPFQSYGENRFWPARQGCISLFHLSHGQPSTKSRCVEMLCKARVGTKCGSRPRLPLSSLVTANGDQ